MELHEIHKQILPKPNPNDIEEHFKRIGYAQLIKTALTNAMEIESKTVKIVDVHTIVETWKGFDPDDQIFKQIKYLLNAVCNAHSMKYKLEHNAGKPAQFPQKLWVKSTSGYKSATFEDIIYHLNEVFPEINDD